MPDIRDLVDEAVSYQNSQAHQVGDREEGYTGGSLPAIQRLQQTIRGLEEGVANNGAFIKHVRYPKTLIKALKELEMLIGNDSIKGDVADNVNNIIMNKLMHEQNPNIALEKSMLNIALYGPPGVGKTTIGAKLAKIVYALGYLNDKSKSDDTEDKIDLNDFIHQPNNDASAEWISMVIVIFYVVMIVLAIVTTSRTAFSDMSWTGIIMLTVLLILVVAVCAYAFWPKNKARKEHKKPTHNVDLKIKPDTPADGVNGEEGNGAATGAAGTEGEKNKIPDEPEIPDDELLTVVTRTDLVSRYTGNSDKDTLEVLRKNMGKVLFIDEAYQLYNSDGVSEDKYGKEVLNVINQFLSEHPKDIVIIFAGYKEDMYNSIFKANPGLERRVMWHFDCKGYSGEELYRILEFMCKQKGWTFRNPEDVKELVINYADVFRNYGGDMEKVGLFARSAYNTDMIDPGVKEKPIPGILETRHILTGIKKLQQNSENAASSRVRPGYPSDTKPPIDPHQLNAMMNMLKQPQFASGPNTPLGPTVASEPEEITIN